MYGVVDDTINAMSECPAVSARRGGGIAAVYRYYSNPREGRFVSRDYPWPWLVGPHNYTDHPPLYNQASIQYMGGTAYGIVYTCWNEPYIQAAYFDIGPYCCNVPGDANNDGAVNVGDAVFMINYVFKKGDPPSCTPEADCNNDCALNVGDAVYLINYVFKNGAPPVCGCLIR
jgi:hypothetical protein